MAEKRRYTTSQAAQICGVSVRTLKRWLDRGELAGYRLPLSGDWRIPREDLFAFMQRHALPLEGMVGTGEPKVVIAANDPAQTAAAEIALAPSNFRVVSTCDIHEAGLKVGLMKPDAVVIAMRAPHGPRLARAVIDEDSLKGVKVVWVGNGADASLAAAIRARGGAVLKSMAPAALLAAVCKVTGHPLPAVAATASGA